MLVTYLSQPVNLDCVMLSLLRSGKMETKPVIESLIYHSHNGEHLNKALKLCRIVGPDRAWSARQHQHLDPYLSHFNKPCIIVTIDLIITVFMIVKSPSAARLFDVVKIQGSDTYINTMSAGKISKEISSTFRIKDFMPDSGLKQIIYIPFEEHQEVTQTSEEVEAGIMGAIPINSGNRGMI